MADDGSRRELDEHEEEPLLGEPGDASQLDNKPLYHNFFLGTGTVAQAGVWILVAIVWGSVFSNDLILFSAHPLLNSSAVLLFVQAILVVQPTRTAQQKKQGTYTHAALNDVALLAAIAGLVIIEYNKFDHNGAHFDSPHAIIGLTVYILVVLQALVGATAFFIPSLYGGVDNAKALYKYHRVSGYLVLLLMLAAVCAATQTEFNITTLQMQLWAVVVTCIIILAGVVPRIKLNKFGWLAGR